MIAAMLGRYLLAALAVVLYLPAAAGAEQASAERGYFLHFYTGLGLTEDSDLRIRRPGDDVDLVFRRVSWEDYSLSSPSIPYIGVRAGRYLRHRPWLGVAIDVFHFKVFAETDRVVQASGAFGPLRIAGGVRMDQIVQNYDVANGVNMYLLTALARLRRGLSERHPDGRWRPYAGLGLGPTVLYTHSTVLGERRSGYELGRLGAQLLAGVELQVGRRWDLFAEVKRSWTEANGSIRDGDSETTLESNHLVLGAGRRF